MCYLKITLIIIYLVLTFPSQANKNVLDNVITLRDQKTENLYNNLKKLSTEGKIMYGSANPTTLMYKETHISKGFNNSDVKEITGQNPALHESDFMWFDDPKLIEPDKAASKSAYRRGAVIAYCWHLRGKESISFYARDRAKFTADKELVRKITSGGKRTDNPELDWLYTKLDSTVIATFKEFGFPVIFRPWHEMNGGWFWWGKDNCSPDEYIKLFQITVDYMRTQGVTNVLYAWSPDTKLTMEYYPGDEYVDILGLDIYEMGVVPHKTIDKITIELEKLTDYAASKDKVAAITETGLRFENNVFRYPEETPDYWSKYILEPLVSNPKLNRIVWVLSWYSADWSRNRKSQVYYPYVGMENDFKNGQEAIDDFLKFYNHPATLFEDDLPDMYK